MKAKALKDSKKSNSSDSLNKDQRDEYINFLKSRSKKMKTRPTKYKKEFCQLLEEHMANGLSCKSFCGVIDISEDTFNKWIALHPEFSESKKKGFQRCLLLWEKMGLQGSNGNLKNFNPAAWIFNMKNRFSWTDRVEVSGSESAPIQLAYLATDKLKPRSTNEDGKENE